LGRLIQFYVFEFVSLFGLKLFFQRFFWRKATLRPIII